MMTEFKFLGELTLYTS